MATRKTSAAKPSAYKTTRKTAPKTARAPRAMPAAPAPTPTPSRVPAKPARAAKVAGAAHAAKPVAKTAKVVKAAEPKKAPKLRKKPVRDSFTMPQADFALIAELKARAMTGKRETKKSEVLRAGLHALAVLDTPALVAALGRLQPVKVGRPKSGL